MVTKFITKPVLTINEVDHIRDSFWCIYADEAKYDHEACKIVYDILKLLKTYRDYIETNGEF